MRRAGYLLLFTGSGAAALVYQVAWMRELGLLFGNTTHAAASTLAVFFLGLALGGAWWGRRAPGLARPLVVFGLLELGVAAAALLVFLLLPIYRALYGDLYAALGASPAWFGFVKLLLSAVCLLPAATLMGGTLPVLTQALLVDRDRLGRGGGLLYALNTLGAAAGAFVAAFLLPQALGYRGTYAVALATSVAIGALSLVLAMGTRRADAAPTESSPVPLPRGVVGLAFVSGLLALALEVLWTRAFAQVLQNSVYTFGALVVVYLVALGVGAGVAGLLARLRVAPRQVLATVLVASGVLVVLGPRLFGTVNANMTALPSDAGFGAYVVAVFRHVGIVVFPSTLVLGIVLPYLLRAAAIETGDTRDAGSVIGRLVAWNTVGALIGALIGGFLLSVWVGPWVAIVVVGAGYLLAGALVTHAYAPRLGILLLLFLVPVVAEAYYQRQAARDRMVPFQTDRATGERTSREVVVEVYEGASGTVTVTRKRGAQTLKLRFNRYYTLGASSAPRWERLQAHLPILLHPDPRSVFFLGLGTGVTAGGALEFPVERVVVAEIVPEVVEAAADHFAEWTNGLFSDDRVTIVEEDARAVLRGTDKRYDVIVGDLFLPWKRGVGALFTREQLEAGRERLTEHGVYAQWLPLYQIGERSFESIVRTFLAVFPRVTLWRGDMLAERPIVAVVGHASDAQMDASAYHARFRAFADRGLMGFGRGQEVMAFHLYAGDAGSVREAFDAAPINTDDRPWLELEAPRDQRARAAGEAGAFVAQDLLAFYAQLDAVRPRGGDAFFTGLTAAQRRWIDGGRHMYAYAVARSERDPEARAAARAAWERSTIDGERPDISKWIR